MKSSRPLLSLLLAFVLLFAQHAGFAHVLSHLADDSVSQTQGKSVAAELPCDNCVTFAQFGSALPQGSATVPCSAPAAGGVTIVAAAGHAAACPRAFHARAPPLFS